LKYFGKWNFQEMEQWDEDVFNEAEQAHIKINKTGSGSFVFCYVYADIDGK